MRSNCERTEPNCEHHCCPGSGDEEGQSAKTGGDLNDDLALLAAEYDPQPAEPPHVAAQIQTTLIR